MRGLDEGEGEDGDGVVVVGRGEKSFKGEVGEDIERDRKGDAREWGGRGGRGD